MEDLAKTLKAQLYDRVASPLIFSLISAWCLWNFRLILIVLSGSSTVDKFHQIDALPYSISILTCLSLTPAWWVYWITFGVLGPIAGAVFYLRALPWFEAKAFEWSQQKVSRLKAIKLKAERDKPVGERERLRLNREVRNAERRLDTELDELKKFYQKELSAVQQSLAESQGRAEVLQQDVSRLKDEAESSRRDVDWFDNTASKILFLEEGARDLLNEIGRGGAYMLRILYTARDDDPVANRKRKWLGDLVAAELVEEKSGAARLTGFGHKLYAEYQRSKE